MKQFLLFTGYIYYPGGGMEDFDGDFDSLDEALTELKRIKEEHDPSTDWWHIYDGMLKTIVKKSD